MKRIILFLCLCMLTACNSTKSTTKNDSGETMPAISVEESYKDNYIVQGTCRVDDYILIAVYNPDWTPSGIMIYDLAGNFVKMVYLDNNYHLGAISCYEGYLYICGFGLQPEDPGYLENANNSMEALMNVYRVSDIINNNGETVNKVKTIYYVDDGKYLVASASTRTPKNSLVSSLDIVEYNGQVCIFTCNYNKESGTHLVIIPISSIQSNGLVDNSQITAYSISKDRIQGIKYIGDNQLLLTQTNGKKKSKLFKCTIKSDSLKVDGSCSIPAHAEQISYYDENTIMVSFEQKKNIIKYYDLDSLEF